jgi:hypothetical protein
MNICPQCGGFSQKLNILTAREYRDIARQLIEIVGEGTFLLVRADCPLQEIVEGTWPGDMLEHEFECFACGRRFALSADTYHGNVSWTPGEFSEPRGSRSKPN